MYIYISCPVIQYPLVGVIFIMNDKPSPPRGWWWSAVLPPPLVSLALGDL